MADRDVVKLAGTRSAMSVGAAAEALREELDPRVARMRMHRDATSYSVGYIHGSIAASVKELGHEDGSSGSDGLLDNGLRSGLPARGNGDDGVSDSDVREQ